MKRSFTLVMSITIISLFAVQSFAQVTIFDQGIFSPASGDHGVFSSRTVSLPDSEATVAFDDFTVGGTGTYDITTIGWDGIYDEEFPASPADTSFQIDIWADTAGVPDLGAGSLYSFALDGGVAGVDDADVETFALGHTSPATDTSPGGGEAYHYHADLAGTESLSAGTKYWLSIQAVQTFPTVDDNDPIWQWHLGEGSDGFYAQDTVLDPMNTPSYGVFQEGKNLSFHLETVPEPSSFALIFAAACGLGIFRRRR